MAADDAVWVRLEYAFKWEGRVCWDPCGTRPTATLEEIRSQRKVARGPLKSGVNPFDHMKAKDNPAELINLCTVVPPSHPPAIRDRVLIHRP